MNKRIVVFVAVIAACLALSGCDMFPLISENAQSREEIRSDIGGYTFTTIPNYRIDESSTDMGMYRIDPNDIDWGDPNYTYEAGPSIQLYGFIPPSELTIEEFAENGVRMMSGPYNATISGPLQVFVAGVAGIEYDLDYEIPGTGPMKLRDITVAVTPNQFFNVRCFSTVEKWEKTLDDCDAVINSVSFFEPKP